MSNQVIECWNCHHNFEVSLERKPTITIYKDIEPNTNVTTGNHEMEDVNRPCPFCGKDNVIRIPKEN